MKLGQNFRMLALSILIFLNACKPHGPVQVRVLYAGSLIVPFTELETTFEAAHPEIDLLMEGHGSIQCIRLVTELHEPADLLFSADSELIPELMYNTLDPDTGQPYADWLIMFATNTLTLAYTDQSLFADEINADNWYEVISRPGVRLGLSDPRFDAAGYRSLMALQLAEEYYENPLIFEDRVMGQFQWPVRSNRVDNHWNIHIPEIVEPKPDSGIVLRGGSVQLIALLESGNIDYAFEYESVAHQHGFRTIKLPDEINLGQEQFQETYQSVEVVLDFQRFENITPVFSGDLIRYGLTIPSNSAHPQEAQTFAAFLLGPEGQAIMDSFSHPLLQPALADRLEQLPVLLKPFVDAMSTQE
ncbi:MAG: tungstate ABC transporter substrate-binding protein WtpA [Anaerolineales bacterium]|nr:tungstate ABC transporter substrate-binding protein WtpA [Anaerolineales bacterium]